MTGRSIRSRAPRASSEATRRIMQANVGRETEPDRVLRREIYRRGMRFWKYRRPVTAVRCEADIVFPRQRVCVFVDGCFWHGCPVHFRTPKTNSEWWSEKIAANRTRDRRQATHLREAGWYVVRVWTHDLTSFGLPRVADLIEVAVRSRR